MRFEQRIEQSESLDGAAARAAAAVAPFGRGAVRDVLSGDAFHLGHPLHPLLTDLPIGFWTSSWVLDIVGGPGARRISQRFVGLGLISAAPTAWAGWSDWLQTQETDPATRRVGVVHAASVGLAAFAYLQSWLARRRGHHRVGVVWGHAGAGLATVGGHLGGHLAFGLASDDESANEPAVDLDDQTADGAATSGPIPAPAPSAGR